MKLEQRNWLDKTLVIGWLVTVFSMLFYDCLLRFELPIGGNIFLFRIAILVTMLIFVIKEFRDRTFFVKGLFRTEWALLILIVVMALYGVVSIAFSLSISAWFSKFLMMAIAFGFLFIYVKLGQNDKVQKITMWILLGTTAICLVGGFLEGFIGCFFDTPYEEFKYNFFGRDMQAPIFTFYNTNGFIVTMIFALMVLMMYAFKRYDAWNDRQKKALVVSFVIGFPLLVYFCCIAQGRLTLLALPFMIVGTIIWMAMRKIKGVWVLCAAIIVTLGFILFGENYEGIMEFVADAHNTPGLQLNIVDALGQNPRVCLTKLFVVVRDETGAFEGITVVQQADNVRFALLSNAFEMIVQSRCLGIGLGNAEIRMANYTNVGSYTNVHCLIAELVLEFGIFALIPLVVLFFSIFKNYFFLLRYIMKERDRSLLANTVFQIFTVVMFPILSTINSSSWGIMPMWLYVGYIIIDQTSKLRTIKGVSVSAC